MMKQFVLGVLLALCCIVGLYIKAGQDSIELQEVVVGPSGDGFDELEVSTSQDSDSSEEELVHFGQLEFAKEDPEVLNAMRRYKAHKQLVQKDAVNSAKRSGKLRSEKSKERLNKIDELEGQLVLKDLERALMRAQLKKGVEALQKSHIEIENRLLEKDQEIEDSHRRQKQILFVGGGMGALCCISLFLNGLLISDTI